MDRMDRNAIDVSSDSTMEMGFIAIIDAPRDTSVDTDCRDKLFRTGILIVKMRRTNASPLE